MSIQTRRSQGSWSNVRSYSTYSNVISNYAQALQQVQENQGNIELEKKVLEYKNGLANYSDVVSLVNSRLAQALPNSQKELDMRTILLGLEEYETTKNRDIKRAQLETKYAKGGISAQERLLIEKELLSSFKEGTPAYSEQLSTIAAATELSAQEQKNVKMAEIQTQLSEGGLTTDEEISLYEEGKNMAEPGTEEYAVLERKVNEAKVRKEQEEIEQKANEKYLELLDKFKDGGVTNEENLKITRELLDIYKPGTEEYTKTKEAEADLLGEIAKESAGSGKAGQRAEEEAKAVEFSALEAKLENVQNKFDIGAISLEDYLAQQGAITEQQNAITESYPDILSPNVTGELQTRFQSIQELRNDIQTGNAVVIKTGSKEGGIQKQAIVPLSELSAYGQNYSILTPSYDAKGNMIENEEDGNVVTIVENGVEKQVLITKTGKLEELATSTRKGADGKEELVFSRTGKVLEYGSKTQSTEPAQPQSSTQGSVLGASTVNMSKPTSVTKTSSSSSKDKSSNSSKTTVTTSKPSSTASKVASTASSLKNTVSQISSAVSKSGPSAGAYGSSKILSQGIKPGNIKGTVDIGVTEAVSSAAKKAVSTVKNILGSLFKKK